MELMNTKKIALFSIIFAFTQNNFSFPFKVTAPLATIGFIWGTYKFENAQTKSDSWKRFTNKEYLTNGAHFALVLSGMGLMIDYGLMCNR